MKYDFDDFFNFDQTALRQRLRAIVNKYDSQMKFFVVVFLILSAVTLWDKQQTAVVTKPSTPKAETTPTSTSEPTQSTSSTIRTRTIDIGISTLTILNSDNDSVTALAQPFIPRNDGLVLAAIGSLARDAWNVRILDGSERVENGEIVLGPIDGHTYHAFLIKEDTGEIHTIRLSRR